jgi:flagellar protein FlaI
LRFWFDDVLRIRRFKSKPMSVIDLVKEGVLNIEMLAYVWLCLENGLSLVIAGPSETGKTTVLNAMPELLHPNRTVSSAEREPELILKRDGWSPFVDKNLFNAVRNALKQGSDYTVVSDIEGEEVYLTFTGMDSGLPAIATIGADNLNSLLETLSTLIPKPMAEKLDIILFMALRKKRGEYIRRIVEINEVVKYDRHSGQILTNKAFQWNAARDDFEVLRSVLLYKLGFDEESLKKDIERKVRLLSNAVKKKPENVSELLFK